MKHLILLSQLLLLTIATSAEAHHGESCLDQSSHLKTQERAAYLTGCLAEASSPAKVQEAFLQEKRLRCTQNAKNLKLQGDEKAGYINTCLAKNEAAEAAAKITAARIAASHPPSLASTAGTDSAHK